MKSRIVFQFAKFGLGALFASGLISIKGYAHTQSLQCIPENNQSYPAAGLLASGLSFEEYNSILDRVEAFYASDFLLMGGELKVDRDWENAEVNASAYRDPRDERIWVVQMMGGLARHPLITPDAFGLVACHEVGHHIGGAPKVWDWATNEGQADYYGTLKCLRRVFEKDSNEILAEESEVPEELRGLCRAQFGRSNEGALCIRSIQAGMDLSRVFADLVFQRSGTQIVVEFLRSDTGQVSKTVHSHPQPQCRFDTYRAGALCAIPYEYPVSQNNVSDGTCNVSSGHILGTRPECWYGEREGI